MHPALDKRVFDKEAVSLVNHGFEVVHIAPDENPKTWNEKGVDIITYDRPGGLKGRILQLKKLYTMAKQVNADVYHCNEVDSWFVGVFLKLRFGKPCVFDVHEHYPEEFAQTRFPQLVQPLVTLFISVLMTFLSFFTTRVVLAKKSLERDFRFYSSKNIVAVQNFSPIASFTNIHDCDATDSEQTILRDTPLKLIHLGLINRNRGWPQILEGLSIAKNKNVELSILGKMNDGSQQEFESAIMSLGLSERVQFESWLPIDEALKKVNVCDVGLIMFQPGLFNHVHALPHKLFDYMGSKLAVIAPRFAVEVSEIVSRSDCGILVDSSSAESFAAAIDCLSEDRAACKAYGEKGSHAVLTNYNWETEEKMLVNMYKELAKQYTVY
ncbi:hypothetical protein AB835_08555 [Candidatus Endobugula sertula]|uniref:Glycosyltransferase subfamily 4-like N-terminal domain-containing protein n=1 Tax=Candidatus Endobugula sertula TaxID=62101 RepID=A0A1D2QPF6_9GAMM|nr:hypothetical protein AB835_08555 [Candidatus Endobugula sertula]